MKSFMKFFAVIVACATLVFASGCASTGGFNNQAAEQALITSAAAVGTTTAITPPTGNPAYIPYFVAGQNALSVVAGSTNQLSVSAIESALQSALASTGSGNPNVNAEANLVIPLVVNILNADLENSTNAVIQNQQLQLACEWIATGIGQGLVSANIPPAKLTAKLEQAAHSKK